MQIYVTRDGQPYGPYTLAQLQEFVRQRNFNLTDLACHDGQNWMPVSQIPGFHQGGADPNSLGQHTPPVQGANYGAPQPGQVAQPQFQQGGQSGQTRHPIQRQHPTTPTYSRRRPRSTDQTTKQVIGIVVGVVFVALVGIGIFLVKNDKRSSDSDKRSSDSDKPRQHLSSARVTSLRSEIREINSRLTRNENSADTVFQEQAYRIQAAVELTAVIAECLGADRAHASSVQSTMATNDRYTDTVYQQIAARQRGLTNMLGLAAESAGASSSSVSSVKSASSTSDSLADTVNQQIAARILASLKMANLLAEEVKVSSRLISAVMSRTTSNDRLSDTVYQQMAARQQGLFEMLELVAKKKNGSSSRISSINSTLSRSEINADTVHQQVSARMKATVQMLSVIAETLLD